MEQLINELHDRATQLFEEGKYSEAEPLLKILSAQIPDMPMSITSSV